MEAKLKASTSELFAIKPEPADETYIFGVDNVKLLYKHFKPLGTVKASVILIHGFGEHHGRFLHVIQSFLENGLAVHTMDLRGHGLSGGGRADGTFMQFLEDIKILHGKVDPSLPCFIYGHSMGGLLVLSYCVFLPQEFLSRIDGVIVTSPWIRLYGKIQPSWIKMFLLRITGDLFDQFLITSNVDPCSLSNRDKVASETINDRLMLPFLTVKFAKELVKYSSALMKKASEFHYPILLVHGAKDRLTDHQASVSFVKRVQSEDKTARIYVTAYHEIHNDKDAVQLLQEVTKWIHKRCSAKVGVKANDISLTTTVESGPLSSRQETSLPQGQTKWERRFKLLVGVYLLLAIVFKVRRNSSSLRSLAWPVVLLGELVSKVSP
jgi:acylglycerol lipase